MLSQRIRGFDGLRAIAFLLVFVSHKVIMPVTDRIGSLAVWIFFVLSGFLITRILAGQRSKIEMGRTSRKEALLGFYLTRAFRIFPPYYALLAVLAILAASGHYDLGDAGRQWANLLFYSNIYIERHGWRDDLGHFWSLAVEQQYYLVFAPLVLFLPRAVVSRLCVALLIVSIAATVLFIADRRPPITFDVNSLVNIGLFGFGGLAGLFADRPLPRWLLNDWAIVIVFALVLSPPILLSNPEFAELSRPAVGFLAACLLVQITQCQDGLAVRALDLAPIRWVGVISYGAYLFHPVIHSNAFLEFFGLPIPLLHRWIVVLDFLLTILFASASWLLLEQPLIRLRQRLTTRQLDGVRAFQKG
ncbi:acyltransferase [Hyphomicrobium sp. 802]|uniref:acyltransferase family protein n=1 Tax=Hyphomicrobium sp. 802 TaxID=1112272 RepID=UPI00045E9A6C|nr:acyltransferase [Hyphomicrobium sp. 802]